MAAEGEAAINWKQNNVKASHIKEVLDLILEQRSFRQSFHALKTKRHKQGALKIIQSSPEIKNGKRFINNLKNMFDQCRS